MQATLIKWDAATVGETPPVVYNGRIYKNHGPFLRWLHRVLVKFGIDINPGQPFDPANTAGCLEVIETDGTGSAVTYRR
jgi:hypothetical protein